MVDTVIVALPEADDYVNRISSQKAPHLTLMYLGEEFDMNNLEPVVRYLKHIAETSLYRFGLSVDRRAPLGEKQADVLFFEDGWQTKKLKETIGYLLADDHIALAYNQQKKKFPKWVPHLTLGYPDEPAKKDERDYPGIHWVNFDRIAIWTGDSEGPEFRLKSHDPIVDEAAWSDELAMRDSTDLGSSFAEYFFNEDILAHYGVKGMRWGIRRDPVTGIRPIAQTLNDDAFGRLAQKSINRHNAAVRKRNQKASAKTLAVKDAKYEQQFKGTAGWVRVNNAVADKINPRLGPMNAAHQKKYGDVDLTDPKNKAARDAYFSAYKQELQKALDETVDFFGANASETKRIQLDVVGDGFESTWRASFKNIKHAEGDISILITPTFDVRGWIVGQEFKIVVDEAITHSEEFAEFVLGEEFDELMHYGVKGMRWGVRKADRVPTGVALTTRPGRKVKAKGGKFEAPSEDAKKAATLKQKAKGSSTDSLSNQELKQMIERMQLEANYQRLTQQKSGSELVKKLFLDPKYRNRQVEGLSELTMPVRKTARAVNLARRVGDDISRMNLSGIGR